MIPKWYLFVHFVTILTVVVRFPFIFDIVLVGIVLLSLPSNTEDHYVFSCLFPSTYSFFLLCFVLKQIWILLLNLSLIMIKSRYSSLSFLLQKLECKPLSPLSYNNSISNIIPSFFIYNNEAFELVLFLFC